MLLIPLTAVPAQRFSVVLAGQNCQIAVYQKTTGLYLDLLVSNTPIIQAQLCRDRVPMAALAYLGFIGELWFADTEGVSDPDYTGLGARFRLVYE